MIPPLVQAIHGIYDGLPTSEGHSILHPYIGSSFVAETADSLRVMAIGVNAYCQPHETLDTERWANGFRDQEWRFQRLLLRDLETLTDRTLRFRCDRRSQVHRKMLYLPDERC